MYLSWMTGQQFFQALLISASRKYPYQYQRKSLEIPRRWGVSMAQLLNEKYEAKLEIPEGRWEGGGGYKPNDHPWWRNGYFL